MIEDKLMGIVEFEGNYNRFELYTKLPSAKGKTKINPCPSDMHAHLYITSSFMDTDWCNWDETSYNLEFKAYTGFGFRRADYPTLPDINEPIKDLYNRFIDKNFIEVLKNNLGKEIIRKKNSNSYYFVDSQQYLEFYTTLDKNEFLLDINFSKIVIYESGKRRVKLYHTGQTPHKTGIKISFDQFEDELKSLFSNAFNELYSTFSKNVEIGVT